MTQEEKFLLLQDLCIRLPYGLKVKCGDTITKEMCELVGINAEISSVSIRDRWAKYYLENVASIKPYLRPMSSMTEEEKKDILQSLNIHGDIDNEGNLLLGVECNKITLKVCKKYLGELNKRMFDVCHMIEKGLALEAPERMYDTKYNESTLGQTNS